MAPKPVYNQPDIHHFLKQEVKRSDGSFGPVYSCVVKKNTENWFCYVCDAKVGGPIEMHNAGKRHKMRLALPNHPVDLWKKMPNDTKQVVYDYRFAPGEPIPPGMETSGVPGTVLKQYLDEKMPLNVESTKATEAYHVIGLEYVIELVYVVPANVTVARYVCLLCNETRPDCGQCVDHLLEVRHLQLYMSRHFTNTYRLLNSYVANAKYYANAVRVMRKICESIVRRDGRLMPHSAQADSFEAARNRYLDAIETGLHFFDTETDNFKHLIDIKFITTEAGRDTDSPLSQISSDSNGSLNGGGGTGADDVETTATKLSRASPTENSGRNRSRTLSVRDSNSGNSVVRKTHTENSFAFWNSYYNNTRVANPAKVLRVRKRRSVSRSPSPPPPRRSSTAHYSRHSNTTATETDVSVLRRHSRHQSPVSSSTSMSWNRRGPGDRRRSRSRSRSSRSPNRSRPHHYQSRGGRRSRSRSRDPTTINRWRSVTPPGGRPSSSHADRTLDRTYENSKRAMYEKRVRELNDEMMKVLAEHEDNPEDHPLYASEWNQFWNRRYRELQSHDIDPTDYDFKPEWIEFWSQRMKDLHAAELRRRRDDLMKMYEIRFSDIDPDTYHLLKPKHDDRYSHHHHQHHHRSNSYNYAAATIAAPDTEHDFLPIPVRSSYARPAIVIDDEPVPATIPLSLSHRKLPHVIEPDVIDADVNGASLNKLEDLNNEICVTEKDINLVGSLRLLCAVEDRIGASLGPKIVDLLTRALQMEKKEANSAEQLLEDDEIVVLFETAKEKLKGQVLANLIESRRAENAIKDIVRKIAGLVHFANERKRKKIFERPGSLKTTNVQSVVTAPAAASNSVDKLSIAAQITSALLEQGRTDISTEELERLIGTVIGGGGGATTTSSSSSKEPYDPDVSTDRFSDDELKLLVQNYEQLSDDEQKRLVNYLKMLEANDPGRVRNLKSIIPFDKIMAKKTQHGDAGESIAISNGNGANKLAEVSDDDDDDIDYNYDDMFKSVKANLKGKIGGGDIAAGSAPSQNTSTSSLVTVSTTTASDIGPVDQHTIKPAEFKHVGASSSSGLSNRLPPQPVSAPSQTTGAVDKAAGNSGATNSDFLTKNFAETQKLIDKIMQDLAAKQKPNLFY